MEQTKRQTTHCIRSAQLRVIITASFRLSQPSLNRRRGSGTVGRPCRAQTRRAHAAVELQRTLVERGEMVTAAQRSAATSLSVAAIVVSTSMRASANVIRRVRFGRDVAAGRMWRLGFGV